MTHKSRERTLITGFLPKPTKNELLFMQNEPNFRKAKINLNLYSARNYEDFQPYSRPQNKPNSNPIKANLTQLKPISKQNEPNTNPIKPNFKLFAMGCFRRKLCPVTLLNGKCQVNRGEPAINLAELPLEISSFPGKLVDGNNRCRN